MKRSDLIYESGILENNISGADVHRNTWFGTSFIDARVSREVEHETGQRAGRYVTVFTDKGDVKKCLSALISGMIPSGTALAAGLGNENISSDSVGVKALRYIPATAHLSSHPDFEALGMRRVCVLETGVTGKTGIESSRQISCISELVGASFLIIIDSLACASPERLCRTIQLTDTGISPGSGVGNDRQAINSETAGIPVIAIGVPTVIDLESLADNTVNSGLMVTPRNIDVLSDSIAETVGMSVSMALNPTLDENELRSLIV